MTTWILRLLAIAAGFAAALTAVVVGAMLTNLQAGVVVEGGSTITQQFVKNVSTSGDRTFGRKLREAAIAIRLEDRLSTQEILERYRSDTPSERSAAGTTFSGS